MKLSPLPILLTAFCAGCSALYAPSTPTLVGSTAFAPFTPIPTLTSVPTALPTLTATPMSAPFVPFNVTTWADNVILRAGPGYLFTPRTTLKKGASLLLLGRSPGGEWLFVQVPDSRTGWVFAELTETQGDLDSAPLIQPADAQLIRGIVKDANGQPINGIQFAFVQGAGDNPPRNDAMTDDSGTFYAFMPLSARGQWTVGYTAVACTSRVMDANCNCKNGVCGQPYPGRTSITLPTNDAELNFIWR